MDESQGDGIGVPGDQIQGCRGERTGGEQLVYEGTEIESWHPKRGSG